MAKADKAEDVEKLGTLAQGKFGVEADNAEKNAAKDMNQCNCFGYRGENESRQRD